MEVDNVHDHAEENDALTTRTNVENVVYLKHDSSLRRSISIAIGILHKNRSVTVKALGKAVTKAVMLV